jgi:23S rRNA (adenine2503-C2)-methyltransferase
VTLLSGINDSDDDARALADRVRAFAAETGRMPRLSIIAYNAINSAPPSGGAASPGKAGLAIYTAPPSGGAASPGKAAPPSGGAGLATGPFDPFVRSSREAEYRASLGIPNHRRYSGGGDVAAACGQLAARDV